jgi:hypothetical protein
MLKRDSKWQCSGHSAPGPQSLGNDWTKHRDAGHFIQNPKPHRAWRGRVRPAGGCFANGSARQSAQAVLARSFHCLAVPQIMVLVSTTIGLNRSTGTLCSASGCNRVWAACRTTLYGPLSSVGASAFSLGKVLLFFTGIFPKPRIRLDAFANVAEVQRSASIYIHASQRPSG